MKRSNTIFLDIDGTLLKHTGGTLVDILLSKAEIIFGVLEKLREWDLKGYNIILTTGRTESMRDFTIKQLEKLGIPFDQLVMGLGGGKRFLINDEKPDGTITAVAFSIKRNEGIKNIKI